MTFVRHKAKGSSLFGSLRAIRLLVVVTAMMVLGNAHAAAAGQKTFESPEDAVKALAAAIRTNDSRELLPFFGPEGTRLIFSGDAAVDRAGCERFVKAYEAINQLEKRDENRVILHVGGEDWPFPVPIVREGRGWFFSINEGKEEILNQRIGRNELAAMQVCHAIVDAQIDYASEDRDGDRILEYARQIVSDSGKRNGLYWPVAEGEDASPLGPLIARASRQGDGGKKPMRRPEPYHGYFYRILTAQGKHVEGGARDYLVSGKMIGGFALVAYPAEYGKTGIMTFIVNQDGVIYEKDLGANTAVAAGGMKTFEPNGTWKRAE